MGTLVPVIGGPIFALVMGIALRLVRAPAAYFQPGLTFGQKTLLQAAVVMSGSALTIRQIWSAGTLATPLILITILAGLVLIPYLGRSFGLGGKVTHLVAVGTAICGATAIGAVTPVIAATAAEMAYAISTIFVFNTLAVVVYPLLGHLSGFTDWMFGLWTGTAIHDTSSVLAAAYSFSEQAGQYATVVKMARTTMLLPVIVGYGLLAGGDQKLSLSATLRKFPQFVLWFAVAAAMNSLGWIPASVAPVARFLSKFLMVAALAAVGLNTDFKAVTRIGPRPMLLGLAASLLIGGVSWAIIRLFYA
ncbi:hypothetical protein caldi_02650 [Caldinitratiruptor microaerophilus]|uniref:Sulfate exporter family transporter n=2 Tax=Caldinitratiruptor microaerophilus TaxID=671077 RepID=A0AA35CHN6_9FIRM|nr:hypothetical protein caldi_02650 [Caldinitratiruptor microaerophilus]